jgi:hypothetical protein
MTQKCDRRDSGSCKNIVLRACWPQTFQHPHRRQQQAMSLRALQLAARQALKEPMGTQLLLQARSYASCTLLPWSSPRPESTAAAFYQTSASSADSTTHSGVLQHLQALKVRRYDQLAAACNSDNSENCSKGAGTTFCGWLGRTACVFARSRLPRGWAAFVCAKPWAGGQLKGSWCSFPQLAGRRTLSSF